MDGLRIHASMKDVDVPRAESEQASERRVKPKSERMVICETAGEIQHAVEMGLQYAVRDNDIFHTRLGPLHKLSLEQIAHIAEEYDNTHRERWGFSVPNVVIDLPWTWRMLTPNYKEKLGMLLYGISHHRLFLVLDQSLPHKIRRYPWDRLRVSTENILFRHRGGMSYTKLRDEIGKVGIGKMMIYCGHQSWEAHTVLFETDGVDGLMTGVGF